MKFHGEAAVRLLDVGFRRVSRHIEELVVILLRHCSPWGLSAHKNEPPVTYIPAVLLETIHPHTTRRRSGLLAVAFLDFFELGIQHVIFGRFVRLPPDPPASPAPPAAADCCSYIFCSSAEDACSRAWVLRSMSSRSSPLIAVLTAATASLAVFFSSSEILSPASLSAFSTV